MHASHSVLLDEALLFLWCSLCLVLFVTSDSAGKYIASFVVTFSQVALARFDRVDRSLSIHITLVVGGNVAASVYVFFVSCKPAT